LLFLVVQKDASLGNMLYSAQINNFMSILKSDNKKTQAYAAFMEKKFSNSLQRRRLFLLFLFYFFTFSPTE